MKIAKNELIQLVPLSSPTISRLEKQDHLFPTSSKIGRQKYYDLDSIFEWLSGRASNDITLTRDDRILNTESLCALLNRSQPWVWLNLIKTRKVTIFNLSPENKSSSRNYFLKREISEMFPELIELATQEAA